MKLFNPKKNSPLQSWVSPKTERGAPSRIAGKCLKARHKINKNEVIVVKSGRILNRDTLFRAYKQIKGAEAQITDDLFIAPLTSAEVKASMAYVNHSCEPNAGFGGNILIIAMRDIEAGEEITIDYSMEWTDSGLKLEGCNCGSTKCRKIITGDDWKNPDLQKKYAGYFSWYIEQKIKAL